MAKAIFQEDQPTPPGLLPTDDLKEDIKARFFLTQEHAQAAVKGAWQIGLALTVLRERIGFGEWENFLIEDACIPLSTARRWMKFAEHPYHKVLGFTSISEAMRELRVGAVKPAQPKDDLSAADRRIMELDRLRESEQKLKKRESELELKIENMTQQIDHFAIHTSKDKKLMQSRNVLKERQDEIKQMQSHINKLESENTDLRRENAGLKKKIKLLERRKK